MNRPKIITGVFVALFASVVLWAGITLLEIRRDLLGLRAEQNERQTKIASARIRLEEQRELLRRLREDPAFVEETIRRKLGYVREKEFIFRFEEKTLP